MSNFFGLAIGGAFVLGVLVGFACRRQPKQMMPMRDAHGKFLPWKRVL